eukprot:c19727_g1_i2.p1 GENE.c19727_g1_i2~~c19727_g1_i2.p1  ORF type:complete len:534 (-),score=219.39 c19727_g1_i2:55-1500(-)
MTKIAIPLSATSLLTFLMGIVDLIMVGHLGKDPLAAASLANTWFSALLYPLIGLLTSLDTFFSQSYGAENYELYGDWLITGLFVSFFISIPAIILLFFTSEFLLLFGQSESIAQQSEEFSYYLIYGLIPLLFSSIFSQYLQCQNILIPLVLLGILSNLLNVAFNYIFIYHLNWGLKGSAIATSTSRVIQCLLSGIYTYYLARNKSTWPKKWWTRIKYQRIVELLKSGVFGAIMLAEESWSFEFTTFLAGLLGDIELDAHTVVMNAGTFLFMATPFPISLAGTIRMGGLLGANDPKGAILAAKVTHILTISSTALNVVIMFACKDVAGFLFTDDPRVVDLVSQIIAIVCIFHLFDGVLLSGSAVLQAMGKYEVVALLNFLGFWILGIGVGSFLTFKINMGLFGLWWGVASGIFFTSLLTSYMILRVNWVSEAKIANERSTEGMINQQEQPVVGRGINDDDDDEIVIGRTIGGQDELQDRALP